MNNWCIVKVDHFDVSFHSLFNHLVEQIKWALSFIFYFFIKCMQSMTMTLSRRCVYAKLHVI